MDDIGMDLGKKESQIAVITEGGELVEKRLRTERERLRQYFKDRPKAKILIEASTISEWVARLVESLGHEVVVADVETTNRYAAVDLETKRTALAKARPVAAVEPTVTAWRRDASILEWLEAL